MSTKGELDISYIPPDFQHISMHSHLILAVAFGLALANPFPDFLMAEERKPNCDKYNGFAFCCAGSAAIPIHPNVSPSPQDGYWYDVVAQCLSCKFLALLSGESPGFESDKVDNLMIMLREWSLPIYHLVLSWRGSKFPFLQTIALISRQLDVDVEMTVLLA